MCGICGELRFDGSPVNDHVLIAMRDRLVHRGPDSCGVFVSPRGAGGLGFRRLRIIDLTPNASQPMANEDGAVQVVFNGEIYNYRALREGLVARGHRFRSHSDTEVIVHLYEEKGAGCIADLEGMFALAIWDERAQRLTLARDRAGKKPLFYYRDDRTFVFASEMKAFFTHPDIAIEPDPASIPYYFLYGYVPQPATIYSRVSHVLPGTFMTVAADGRTTTERYWQLQFPEAGSVEPIGRAEAAAGVRERLTRAVERRLESDVPLGAFLSGGVDSTIVVGLMSRMMTTPVKTFSIGFEGDPAFDETEYARLAAKQFKTDHTEFRVVAVGDRPDRHAGVASRRTVWRLVGDSDLSGVEADARARDGGAHRRRRRRVVRRLPALLRGAARRADSGGGGTCRRRAARGGSGGAERAALAGAGAAILPVEGPAAA